MRAPIFAVLLAAAATSVHAQDATFGGGGGGTILSVNITLNGIYFAASDMSGIYRSTDHGAHWTMLDQRDIKTVDGHISVVQDPNQNNHLFSIHPTGVKQSSFDGAPGTWLPYQPGVSFPSDITVSSMAVSHGAAPFVVLGTQKGAYQITGSSWESIPGLEFLRVIKVSIVTDGTLSHPFEHIFAAGTCADENSPACRGDGVYSFEGGAWVKVISIPGITDFLADSTNEAQWYFYFLYAADGTRFYRYGSDFSPQQGLGISPSGPSDLMSQDPCFKPQFVAQRPMAVTIPNGANPLMVDWGITVSTSNPDPQCMGHAVYAGWYSADAEDGDGLVSFFTWVNEGGERPMTMPSQGWIDLTSGFGWGFDGGPHALAIDPQSNGIALIGNQGGTYTIVDPLGTVTPTIAQAYTSAGATGGWTTTGLDVTSAWNYYHSGNRRFIANTDIGLTFSNDGTAWNLADAHRAPDKTWNTFYELAFDNSTATMWAAASQQHDIPLDPNLDDSKLAAGAVLQSVDNGASWQPTALAPAGNPVVSVLFLPAPPATPPGGAFPPGGASPPGGNTPLPTPPGAASVRPQISRTASIASVPNGDLFASVWGDGVYQASVTAGVLGTWTKWGSPPAGTSQHVYQLHADSSRNVYVSVAPTTVNATLTTGALYRLGSTAGASWQNLTSSFTLPIRPVDFTIDPSFPGGAVIYLATANLQGIITDGLWRLPLAGGTPTPLVTESTPVIDLKLQDHIVGFSTTIVGSTLYFSTIGHGIFQSTDRGATWSHAFPSSRFLEDMRVVNDGGTLYAATFGGGLRQLTP
jgi:hypothetical protein